MLQDAEKTATAVAAWIRHYFENSLPKAQAVVGISGGKDSSVVAALCVKALGADRVIGVMMPNGTQSDIADAEMLAKHLGIRSLRVNIGAVSEAFRKTFETTDNFAAVTGVETLKGEAAINYPARLRMATLYAIAQSLPTGGLVLNTCNMSEDWVGYSTKYGYSAGDLSPLAQFTVTEVRELGRALGLPSTLVDKTPSDGLSGLSDEDKLGFTYAVLDRYIRTGVCEDAATKARIDHLHRINLHKMQLMPSFEHCPE